MHRASFLGRIASLLTLLCVTAACGVGVPEDKQFYVGQWDSEGISLRIGADGMVDYERTGGIGEVTLQGPIQEWRGNDFAVGLPYLTTTFEVQRPPWLENERWRMVVDGVELVRQGDPLAERRARVDPEVIEFLEFGVFGRERGDGTRGIVNAGNRVPGAVGRSFGATFRYHEPNTGILTFHWQHPPIRDPATGQVSRELVLHSATEPGGPHWVSADLNAPEDLVPGAWKLRILDGERVLARKTFELYVP